MDIHRSRFVPYPLSPISALAFSRPSDSAGGSEGALPALKLALGRSNGTIEIWNPQRGLWVQETVFAAGGEDSSDGDAAGIDGLLWTQGPDEVIEGDGGVSVGQQRLFGISASPAVLEFDLGSGRVKRRSTGNFSEVWCFAAQPRARLAKEASEEERERAGWQEIVAGCGDGTLVLLSTAGDDLVFKRFLARVSGKKSRCMCVAWQNRERVVAGFADGVMRVYDARNGSLLRNMSLGAGIPGAPKTALVWQVKCLPNGDIVSGDSNGEVRFWDGRTYSLSQRIAGHESDCLDLISSSDGKTLFSGSIDGKLAVYRQTVDRGRKTWAKTSHRRLHHGEVKTMAAFDSKGMSVVVSGSSDVAPVITPLREYGKENIRFLPTLPQSPPLVSAPKARLFASWWDKTISIWHIAKRAGVDSSPEPQKRRTLVARICLDTKDDIRSVTMSPDGRLLAASTSTAIKVFQLKRKAEHEAHLAIRKLELPHELADAGARVLKISPDSKWLAAATTDDEIYVARFAPHPAKPKQSQLLNEVAELETRHRPVDLHSAFRSYDRATTQMVFSDDSAVLVASDLSGNLDSWVLKGEEDPLAPAVGKAAAQLSSSDSDSDSDSDSSDDDDEDLVAFYAQTWTENPANNLLPKLDSTPLIMTFRPTRQSSSSNTQPKAIEDAHNPNLPNGHYPTPEQEDQPQSNTNKHHLLILTSRHQLYEFDIAAGRLTDWSRRNPSSLLPPDFTKIRDRVMGAVWDKERLWIYGSSFLSMLDLGVDFVDSAASAAGGRDTNVSTKRRRKAGDQDAATAAGGDQNKRRKSESGAGAGTITEVELEGQGARILEDDASSADESDFLPPSRLRVADAEEAGGDGDGEGMQLAVRKEGDGLRQRRRRWWCTFKYRPILGLAVLGGDEAEREMEDGEDAPLEVVLVERVAEGGS
ncbi:quinon protein alcohol dehydrogenase-like superfamily [Neohortaea acidophila]|uniref:Quinon protein alcohol dehydrogenase-like superfamily n=1 Tax=Neohortaea acidophila TaxID=245834 RepID=A0A6A6Q1Y4_9PEZI|nr:quinon protein alcohol dehydrogenase-like superfamily [Neohortaea acidophila]KAF2486508.1 quinon protein alcohol dehydrogenase-like superfamily [Neohortaea acidophila]